MSDLLLDTCAFLWIAWEPGRLSQTAALHFQDPGNRVFLSAASSWEIAIKQRLGKIRLPRDPLELVPEIRERHSIESLPIDEESTLRVALLPDLHNDPFDRMLVSQSITNGLTLLTPDDEIRQYPVRAVW